MSNLKLFTDQKMLALELGSIELRSKLEKSYLAFEPLTKVLGWCLDPEYPDTQTIETAINQAGSPDALEAKLLALPYTFPETAHRAIRLLWSAQVEGFAAFG